MHDADLRSLLCFNPACSGNASGYNGPAAEDPRISTTDSKTTDPRVTGLLSRYGFILVEGEDAGEFLQSQFSADITALADEQAVLTGWHDHKGRVLSCLKVVRKKSSYWLVLPAALVADTLSGLQRYVLRSKVTLSDASEHLAAAGVVGRDGNRHEIYAKREKLTAAVAQHHKDGIGRIGNDEWELQDIRDGLPEVYPETTGLYTGQMLNLDLIGGISFSKGCYPGQEVIARTHHLGRVKRRMQRYISDGPALPPGDSLEDESGKPAGTVVRSAAAETGNESLVVTAVGHPPVLVTNDGFRLEPAPLPYAL